MPSKISLSPRIKRDAQRNFLEKQIFRLLTIFVRSQSVKLIYGGDKSLRDLRCSVATALPLHRLYPPGWFCFNRVCMVKNNTPFLTPGLGSPHVHVGIYTPTNRPMTRSVGFTPHCVIIPLCFLPFRNSFIEHNPFVCSLAFR